jgi:hypothetical protein
MVLRKREISPTSWWKCGGSFHTNYVLSCYCAMEWCSAKYTTVQWVQWVQWVRCSKLTFGEGTHESANRWPDILPTTWSHTQCIVQLSGCRLEWSILLCSTLHMSDATMHDVSSVSTEAEGRTELVTPHLIYL